jgi:hypothetical protein
MEKLAQLDISDHVYTTGWLTLFLPVIHTVSNIEVTSQLCSKLRPALFKVQQHYVVNAADLKAVTPGNGMCKYSDDTCLITPAS